MSPRAYVPSEQQRAFELALCEYLGLDPAKVSDMVAWETQGDTAVVELKFHVPTGDLLFMFNNGRVPV